jgi:hypothetical protein
LTNILAQIVGGFVSGLMAGIVGYATDIMFGAMFDAFKVFNSLFVFYGIIFFVVSFFAGLAEAYYAGLFFSIGIIVAGFWLKDFVTVLSGVISTAGVVISLFIKLSGGSGSKDY